MKANTMSYLNEKNVWEWLEENTKDTRGLGCVRKKIGLLYGIAPFWERGCVRLLMLPILTIVLPIFLLLSARKSSPPLTLVTYNNK